MPNALMKKTHGYLVSAYAEVQLLQDLLNKIDASMKIKKGIEIADVPQQQMVLQLSKKAERPSLKARSLVLANLKQNLQCSSNYLRDSVKRLTETLDADESFFGSKLFKIRQLGWQLTSVNKSIAIALGSDIVELDRTSQKFKIPKRLLAKKRVVVRFLSKGQVLHDSHMRFDFEDFNIDDLPEDLDALHNDLKRARQSSYEEALFYQLLNEYRRGSSRFTWLDLGSSEGTDTLNIPLTERVNVRISLEEAKETSNNSVVADTAGLWLRAMFYKMKVEARQRTRLRVLRTAVLDEKEGGTLGEKGILMSVLEQMQAWFRYNEFITSMKPASELIIKAKGTSNQSIALPLQEFQEGRVYLIIIPGAPLKVVKVDKNFVPYFVFECTSTEEYLSFIN